MKKYLMFSVMVLVTMCVGFSSCSDDDENSGSGKSLLIGKWEESAKVHWTFDEKFVFIEDEEEVVFNGEYTPYTYDEKTQKLVLGGLATFNVSELTSTDLKLTGWAKINFKRVK